jgi:GLPGLI family protein
LKRTLLAVYIAIAFTATSVLTLTGCGNGKYTEGIIEYDVTYPYFNGADIILRMLPSKMTMKFKDGKFRTTVTKGRNIRMDFISDCEAKTMISAFQFGSKKIVVTLNEKEIRSMLKEFPKVVYIDLLETDTLAGFNCKKKVAVFEDISYPDCELWYTEEIDIPNANWCYPFNDIPGVLLNYEVERYNMRMRLKARKFIDESVDDAEFESPAGYKTVKLKDFEDEVKRFTMIMNG